jgi:hypothetical protein
LHSNQLAGATHGFENASRRRHNSRFEAPGGTAQRVSAGAQTVGVASSYSGGNLGHPGLEVREKKLGQLAGELPVTANQLH